MYVPSFRIKSNGVPILSKVEIEAIAEKLILDYSPLAMQTPTEIDIDGFALHYLGLKQDFQYLSNTGIYLGMAIFKDTNVPVYVPETNEVKYISAKARTIIIDNNLLSYDQEPRYRYTVGHEAGHDIFHRGYFDRQSSYGKSKAMIQCRALSMDGEHKPVSEWTDNDSMEWQANYIASCMLMPKAMVLKLIASLSQENKYCRSDMQAQAVVKTFNVSFQAAQYRLKELGIIKEIYTGISIFYSD